MSSFFIRRPIFAIVISIIIVILGGLSLLSLPIAQYPQISPPTVNLSTTYTGANATIVNQTVAQVIEDQLKGVDDMSYMSSTSSNDGSYSLSVVFSLDSDGNTDAINVQNDANLAKNSLPSDVQTQGLTVRRASGDMFLMANIYSPNGTYNQAFLKNYADIYLLDKIQRIDGVGSVNTFGSSYAMRVWLNPEKLAERGLTVPDRIGRHCGHQGTEYVGPGRDHRQPAGTGDTGKTVQRQSRRPAVDAGTIRQYHLEVCLEWPVRLPQRCGQYPDGDAE